MNNVGEDKRMTERKGPTATEFRRCLLGLRPHSEAYIGLLDAHYRSPNHTATAAEMAAALQHTNGKAIRLFYRALAATLARFFLGREDLTIVLCYVDSDVPGWVLNPELVKALDELTENGKVDLLKVLCE